MPGQGQMPLGRLELALSPDPSIPPSQTAHPAKDGSRRRNLIGALWMIAAMGGFTVEDTLIKKVSAHLPLEQVMVIFGLIGALAFGLVARVKGERLLHTAVLSAPMRIRAVFEISARFFYCLALALIPLSASTLILQATPLVVVASAAVLFGEKVGWRRWTAILFGLAGVMVILRPGTEGMSALSLLAVAGMLGFAGRDLASRAAPVTLGTFVLGFYGFMAMVIAGLLLWLLWGSAFVWPTPEIFAVLVVASLGGAAAYTCLMKAMRTGDVSAVTPFRYVRLIFGVGAGALVFGEPITGVMLLGSVMIVLAGLFLMLAPAPGAGQAGQGAARG